MLLWPVFLLLLLPLLPAASVGHQAAPEGHQATQKGHQATPKGHQTPEGHQATPEGHQATPEGHQATPKGHQATPKEHQARKITGTDRGQAVFGQLSSAWPAWMRKGGTANREGV